MARMKRKWNLLTTLVIYETSWSEGDNDPGEESHFYEVMVESSHYVDRHYCVCKDNLPEDIFRNERKHAIMKSIDDQLRPLLESKT